MDETWVIVETHKGVGQVFSYRGTIRREHLDAWCRGELRGALTLQNAYWVEEDPDTGRSVAVVVGRHPSFRNGTGTLHLAVDTVMVVMELRAADPGVLDGTDAQVLRIGAVRNPERTPEDDAT